MTVNKPVLRISEAARSVFYIPLLATVEAGFLAKEGFQGLLGTEPAKGAERLKHLEQGIVDVLGNTPTLSFLWLEKQVQGEMPLQVAAMNHCDGFYLISRVDSTDFKWRDLESAALVTSNFSLQPLASLRFCLSEMGKVDLKKIKILDDYSSMAAAAQAFRDGVGDFVHLQEPLASILVEEGAGYQAASIGEALGPLAFSTLAMSRKLIKEQPAVAEAFMRAYYKTLCWLDSSDPETIAAAIQQLFTGVNQSVLVRSIKNYKAVGAWQSDPVISKASYERMVDMWIQGGHMQKRYPYEQVVSKELAEKIKAEIDGESGD